MTCCLNHSFSQLNEYDEIRLNQRHPLTVPTLAPVQHVQNESSNNTTERNSHILVLEHNIFVFKKINTSLICYNSALSLYRSGLETYDDVSLCHGRVL